jgi:hypothetical protein
MSLAICSSVAVSIVDCKPDVKDRSDVLPYLGTASSSEYRLPQRSRTSYVRHSRELEREAEGIVRRHEYPCILYPDEVRLSPVSLCSMWLGEKFQFQGQGDLGDQSSIDVR